MARTNLWTKVVATFGEHLLQIFLCCWSQIAPVVDFYGGKEIG